MACDGFEKKTTKMTAVFSRILYVVISFNKLDLPQYETLEDVKKKLEIALTQTEGFGLI
jgi:hypothetical protein